MQVDELKDYYSDIKNCYKDLCEVRKIYNTNTTHEQFDAAIHSLMLMRVHCVENDQLLGLIDATINETQMRQSYAEFGVLRSYRTI